ncbi:MAG: MerR family transcriptional regulator [Nitrospinota bacterium]
MSRPDIPDKLFFKIGEVAEIAQTKPHVLRYWETEFGILKPVKNPSGQRVYRKRDVEVVLEIKRLLHEERFTIAGAKKQLAGRRSSKARTAHADTPPSAAAASKAGRGGNLPRFARELEKDLRRILSILDQTDKKLRKG